MIPGNRHYDRAHFDAMMETLNEMADWHAECPKCHAKLTGTPAQLKAHKCEVSHVRTV